MREFILKFAPLVLPAVCVVIWTIAYLFYDVIGVGMILISCIISQLLLFLCCGIIIQRLYRQASIDSLTGVCNRRSFFLNLSAAIKIKLPVSIMMIDIDNFKRINDTYGHSAGDEALKQFAEILESNTRNTDIVARLVGEEFAVILPKTSFENCMKMAERIKQSIEAKTFNFCSITDRMTISIGISTARIPINIDRFLKHADKALYKAKETKNAIVAYEQSETVAV